MDITVEYEHSKSAGIAAFNEQLFGTLNSKNAIYEMAVVIGPEVNSVDKYKSLKEFVRDQSQAVFECGVFGLVETPYMFSKSSRVVKNYNKLVKAIVDQLDAEDTRAEFVKEFNKLLKIVSTKPDYVIVSFNLDDSESYLAIHKEDYKTLRKFKAFFDIEDYEYWEYNTAGGRKVCA